MNRYKVSKIRPEDDYFCSAYWRQQKPHKIIECPSNDGEEENNLLANLLDEYDEPGFGEESKDPNFLTELINSAIKALEDILKNPVFESSHTIADELIVKFREQLLRSLRRDRGPPILDVGMVAFGGSPEHRHNKEETIEEEKNEDTKDGCVLDDA
jgi:hypothetical protein